ncbi:hypothetical protein ABD05_31055 [Burkholderia pyrrocinia]|nr:hypothetical protein ABD05_31055 [Burkholderia pyrrocinia]GAU07168.1 transposase isrso10 [Burkholderia stabilis]
MTRIRYTIASATPDGLYANVDFATTLTSGAIVTTMKRDYVAFMPKPDAALAVQNLADAFEHDDEKHPHSALKYRSPREFRRAVDSSTVVRGCVRDDGGQLQSI